MKSGLKLKIDKSLERQLSDAVSGRKEEDSDDDDDDDDDDGDGDGLMVFLGNLETVAVQPQDVPGRHAWIAG